MFFWLTAIIPTAYPVAIAMVAPFEIQGDELVSLPYSTPYRVTDLVSHPTPFKGNDYASFCGDTLYAPQNGWVSNIGTDGFCGQYGCGNTFIEFENEVGTETVMLHGDYILRQGDTVRRGQTIIGYEASNGNSSGCHTDFWTNGLLVEIGTITETKPKTTERTSGYLSAYGKSPTDGTLLYRQDTGQIPYDLSPYDVFIAVLDCSDIGKNAILYAGNLELNALVFDCAGVEDGGADWMIQGNYIAEIDYYTWQKYPELVGGLAEIEIKGD